MKHHSSFSISSIFWWTKFITKDLFKGNKRNENGKPSFCLSVCPSAGPSVHLSVSPATALTSTIAYEQMLILLHG